MPIFASFSPMAHEAMMMAKDTADMYQQPAITSLAMLQGLLQVQGRYPDCLLDQIDVADLDDFVEVNPPDVSGMENVTDDPERITLMPSVRELIKRAMNLRPIGGPLVTPEMLMLSFLGEYPDPATHYLRDHGVDFIDARNELLEVIRSQKPQAKAEGEGEKPETPDKP